MALLYEQDEREGELLLYARGEYVSLMGWPHGRMHCASALERQLAGDAQQSQQPVRARAAVCWILAGKTFRCDPAISSQPYHGLGRRDVTARSAVTATVASAAGSRSEAGEMLLCWSEGRGELCSLPAVPSRPWLDGTGEGVPRARVGIASLFSREEPTFASAASILRGRVIDVAWVTASARGATACRSD